MFVSRGRVWGCRSGTGGNKVCVNAKAVGNDNPGNNSPGITVGITIGSGAVGQGARQELHGLKGAGTHSCKIFLTWPLPGSWGLCTGTKLGKVEFPCGVGARKELGYPGSTAQPQQGQQSLSVSVHLSVSCTLWGPLTQCNGLCSLGVGFFYQDKLPIIEKQAAIMCSVWGCCLWRDLALVGGFGTILSQS